MYNGRGGRGNGGRANCSLISGVLTHHTALSEAQGLKNIQGNTCIFVKNMTPKNAKVLRL